MKLIHILTVLFILSVILCPLIASEKVPPLTETRATWLWLSSINTDTKINKVLKTLDKYNFNTVYLSVPLQTAKEEHKYTKQFKKFLKRSLKYKIHVHAWFKLLHRRGRKTGLTLRSEKEREKQTEWITHWITQFPETIRGIHLDYIREPQPSPPSEELMANIRDLLHKVRKIYPERFISVAHFPSTPSKKPLKEPYFLPEWFIKWNRQTDKLSGVFSYSRGKRISCPAFMLFQQDPVTWLSEGLINAIIPMQYTTLNEKWNKEALTLSSFLKFRNLALPDLIMGLGWIRGRSSNTTRGYDIPGIINKIRAGRKMGIKSYAFFILFNHNHNDIPLLEALTTPSGINNYKPPFIIKSRPFIRMREN